MMKKLTLFCTAALAVAMGGCGSLGTTQGATAAAGSPSSTSQGSSVLGSVLGALGSQETGESLLNLVIGSVKLDESSLYGTWKYSEPGCAFTSDQLLAKAGGAVAAGQIKEKLAPAFQQVGISGDNTYFTFDKDGKFDAKVNGIPFSGTYTYDASTSAIKMQTLLFSATGHVTRTTSGIGLMFESKKLLNVLQAVGKLSGNSTVEAVTNLGKNYSGVRLGFDLKK